MPWSCLFFNLSEALQASVIIIGLLTRMFFPGLTEKLPHMPIYSGVMNVIRNKILCVHTCPICEAHHNVFFLLDDFVDMCPSTAKFLSHRMVSFLCCDHFVHLHFQVGGITLCAPFDGVLGNLGAGHFAALLHGCMYVCVYEKGNGDVWGV